MIAVAPMKKLRLVKAVKAIDKLSAEKATMGSQLEQQAL